jgi:hypothetical protein
MDPIDQQELYAELLCAVGNNQLRLPKNLLTGFVGVKGGRSTGELVIIGRAVNGWGDGWYPQEGCEMEKGAKSSAKYSADQIATPRAAQ